MIANGGKPRKKISKQEIESYIKEYDEIENGDIQNMLMEKNNIMRIVKNTVFANTEVHLSEITAFGFDCLPKFFFKI